MTMYERKSFSVPASAGKPETCSQVGHTEPDQRGKCLRCAAFVLQPVVTIYRDANGAAVSASITSPRLIEFDAPIRYVER